jgi:hypothetical protein
MRAREIYGELTESVELTNEISRWETDTKKGDSGLLSDAQYLVKHSDPLAEYKIGMGYTMRYYKSAGAYYYITFDESDKLAGYVHLKNKGKAMQVTGVYAGKNNTYPMYKVYAYLVKKLDIILMSDSIQSDAGEAVWNKLSAEPGITVFGWNTRTKKAINLGNKLDHDTEGDTHTGIPKASRVYYISDNPDSGAENVVLVAIRKQ